MIEIRIEKEFENFSLDINIKSQAQVLAILGPSGSGKTMTLKCISGLEEPDRGLIKASRLYFDSDKNFSMPVEERNIGYLFQSYGLFPNMTALDNVSFVTRPKISQNQALDLLDQLGLKDHANKFPKDLSGGQQQRLALARILSIQPELILLDEPFSALDPIRRSDTEAMISKLIREVKVPAILVSHDHKEVYRFADEVLVLDQGRLEDFGPKDRVFNRPKTARAASLVGFENIFRPDQLAPIRLDDFSEKDLGDRSLAVKAKDIEPVKGSDYIIENKIQELDGYRYILSSRPALDKVQFYSSHNLQLGQLLGLRIKKFHII